MSANRADVVIIGGGPAGLEAALVLGRAGKRTMVFDDPAAPRNAASHGIHNFIGAEGVHPDALRERVRAEIAQHSNVTFHHQAVVDILPAPRDEDAYVVVGGEGFEATARKVILAFGYRDRFPALEGFDACWGLTVIPCPFCDGYENQGRVWGVVPRTPDELAVQPRLVLHWTKTVLLFLSPDLSIENDYRVDLLREGIAIHSGRITRIDQHHGRIEAVTLDSGARHEVGTLLWVPEPEPTPLSQRLQHNLGLRCDTDGFIHTNESFATNLRNVWAIGDVKGWTGALSAAAAGYSAAVALLKSPR
ncbi:MAG: NAD(P)/FAD-dependent oxidoreductase [Myxococcota bacterium]